MAEGDQIQKESKVCELIPKAHTNHNNKTYKRSLLFPNGTLLCDRWRVNSIIQEGGFGQIYTAADTQDSNRMVAIKAESKSAPFPLLHIEVDVLKSTHRHWTQEYKTTSPHFLSLLGAGVTGPAYFIVMQLCGKSLQELRRGVVGQKFSVATSLRIGCQMVRALHHLHDVGWIHRDVKPGNMCMGKDFGTKRTLFLIDFGLCRKYKDAEGQLLPPRKRCHFRGTVRYASLSIHKGHDSARADDLWSTFYILVEQVLGELPWRRVNDRNQAKEAKNNADYETLLASCPSSLDSLRQLLMKVGYFDSPQYDEIVDLFRADLKQRGVSESCPLDWETQSAVPTAAC